MKKYIIATVLSLILIINSNIYADEITDKLDSPDWSVRYLTVKEIVDNNLVQYTYALADRVFNQPTLLLTNHFLNALFIFEYTDIEQYILQFIDLCDQFPQEQPLYYKVKATGLLIEIDNLTTVDYVFEYVNIDPLNNGEQIMPLLKEIAIKMPQHLQAVKEILINIKDNSSYYLSKREALEDLILLFGENNLHDEILSSITNDTNANIRKFAMEYYNFADRKDLLKQQIQNDSHWYLRIMYVENILKNYGQPEDLKFVIDYLPFESDTNASGSIENQIGLFTPLKPDESIPIEIMIKNLKEYIEVLYNYKWILTEKKFMEFDSQRSSIEENIIVPPYCYPCAIDETDRFMQMAEDALANEEITMEGYDFLYYYSSYIKERLEQFQN